MPQPVLNVDLKHFEQLTDNFFKWNKLQIKHFSDFLKWFKLFYDFHLVLELSSVFSSSSWWISIFISIIRVYLLYFNNQMWLFVSFYSSSRSLLLDYCFNFPYKFVLYTHLHACLIWNDKGSTRFFFSSRIWKIPIELETFNSCTYENLHSVININ